MVLATLVERVIPRRVGYGAYEADIAWTPLGDGLREVANMAAAAIEQPAA